MAAVPLTLPACLLDAAKLLFPTLDFSRINFYYQQFQADPDTVCYLTHTDITLNGSGPDWAFDDKMPEPLIIVCHELVHALQGQTFLGRIMHYAAAFTCGFLHGRGSDPKNCVEHEAYAYEDKLRQWLKDHGDLMPWIFSPPPLYFPYKIINPAFVGAVAADPSIQKKTTDNCTPWDCAGPGIWRWIAGTTLGVIALLISAITALGNGTSSTIGGVVGGIVGAAGGAVGGVVIVGSAIGAAGAAVVGGIVGAIVGGLIGAAIVALIAGLVGLFSDDGGALNLVFSQDNGMTFGSRVQFGRSSATMSLAFLDTKLTAAFTHSDNAVEVLHLDGKIPPSVLTFEESEDCGPAITYLGMRLVIAWQGTDNCANTIPADSGGTKLNYALKKTSKLKLCSGATPALCEVSGHAILAYTEKAYRLDIQTSDNGADWQPLFFTGEHADADSSAALTKTKDKQFAIGWVGTDKHNHLNIKYFDIDPTTQALTPGKKLELNERSHSGIALGSFGGVLHLAWTGTDGRINFAICRDGQLFGKQILGSGRKDCAPALVVHEDTGVICVGWTAK
jgi:hypothetical protein